MRNLGSYSQKLEGAPPSGAGSPAITAAAGREVDRIDAFLRASVGLELNASRHRKLQNYLEESAHRLNLSPANIGQRMRSGDERLLAEVVETVTNQETSFMRGGDQLATVRDWLGPALAHRSGGADLRAWSAACSTGEEALTLGILIQEQLDQNQPGSAGVRIVASDISRHAIAHARVGRYSPVSAHRLDAAQINRFFTDADGRCEDSGALQVNWDALPPISYHVQNLLRPHPFGLFDLVVVRNVLFYLTEQAQQHVVRRALRAVAPEGVVVFGANDGVNMPAGFSSLGAHCWQRVSTPASPR